MSWRIKMYILQRNNGLCMHNILTKKLGEMCDISAVGIFLNRWGYFKSHFALWDYTFFRFK